MTSLESRAFSALRAYLDERATLTADEHAFIETKFVPATLAAQEYLQRAGAVAQYSAFVTKGCLRKYTIDADGSEHIIQFAPENWWAADVASLANRTPAQFFIDAVEDSELLLVDGPSHEA